jgi:hypothetical protein
MNRPHVLNTMLRCAVPESAQHRFRRIDRDNFRGLERERESVATASRADVEHAVAMPHQAAQHLERWLGLLTRVGSTEGAGHRRVEVCAVGHFAQTFDLGAIGEDALAPVVQSIGQRRDQRVRHEPKRTRHIVRKALPEAVSEPPLPSTQVALVALRRFLCAPHL